MEQSKPKKMQHGGYMLHNNPFLSHCGYLMRFVDFKQVRLLLSINNCVEFKIFIIQDAVAWSMNSGLIGIYCNE